MRFSGINISSEVPLRLVDFYENILGLKVLEDYPSGDGVIIGNDLNEPVIWIWDQTKWENSNSGFVTFVFNVPNLEEKYKEIIKSGYEVSPITTASWGGKELRLKDPDGNHILILD